MGISSPEDPLFIQDLVFIKQECTSATMEFDEEAQFEWTMSMMESGVNPENFMRVWFHTHPGQSAVPSSTDWETFQNIFAQTDWGVMAILGTTDQMSAVFRLKDQMLNIPVEYAPEIIPEEWVNDLDNITEPKKTANVYNKGNTQSYFADGTGWDFSNQYDEIKNLVGKITGTASYTSVHKWNPTFGEMASIGIGRACTLLGELWALVEDVDDGVLVGHLADKMCEPLGLVKGSLEKFCSEDHIDISPVAALAYARACKFKTISELKKDSPKALINFLVEKDDGLYINAKGMCQHLYSQVSSENPKVYFPAMVDVITAGFNFEDVAKVFDETILNGFTQSLRLQNEEDQCQMELLEQKLDRNDFSGTAESSIQQSSSNLM